MFQFILYVIACLASQKGPLWWASKHRKHHKYCDTLQDPHSPIVHSKLYAWIGWVYLPGPDQKIDREYIKDLIIFPELVIMENFYWVPIVSLHFMFLRLLGIGEMIFISMWSSILCQLLTLYFNVLFHSNKQHHHGCNASNIPLDVLSNLFGEAYHEIHHRYPVQFKRKGMDLPYHLFLKPLILLGFIKVHYKNAVDGR
jgi:stearoyl-CoA desaturase (delta-9 desaturase)